MNLFYFDLRFTLVGVQVLLLYDIAEMLVINRRGLNDEMFLIHMIKIKNPSFALILCLCISSMYNIAYIVDLIILYETNSKINKSCKIQKKKNTLTTNIYLRLFFFELNKIHNSQV